MAGVSGARTLTPQKMVGSIVNQATSYAGVGPGGTGPLDLSNCNKKDAPGSETIMEEDFSGENLRGGPVPPIERIGEKRELQDSSLQQGRGGAPD